MPAKPSSRRTRKPAPPPKPQGKTRITIFLDRDLIDHFRQQAEQAENETGYQTLINAALRQWLGAGKIEDALRRILREELTRRRRRGKK